MKKIKFNDLWSNYPDKAPCNSIFKNQCAIKVGTALAKSGVDTTKLVSSKRHCWFHDKEDGHVLSAKKLAVGINKNKIHGLEKPVELPGKDFKIKITGKIRNNILPKLLA